MMHGIARSLLVLAAASLLIGVARAQESAAPDFNVSVAPQQAVLEPVAALNVAEQQRYGVLDRRPLQELTIVDFAEFMALRKKALPLAARPHPREDVGVFAKRSLGQPFRLFAVQHDLAESDCVTLVNRMLAMAVTSDWNSYYIVVERLMHKDGVVDYRNRNFETLSDWVPNNLWLLRDVTSELGPVKNRPAEPFTYAVRVKEFIERPAAPGSKFTRITYKGPDLDRTPIEEIRQDTYIPVERIEVAMGDLKTGDVALILIHDRNGHRRGDHHALIVRDADEVKILHSTRPRVVEEPLTKFVKRCFWVSGFKFLRLRNDAREIAAREVARLAPQVRVPTPAEQQEKNKARRALRLSQAGTQPAPAGE